MNRVPLIVRTPKCSLTLAQAKPHISKAFQLGKSKEGTPCCELNLRQLFAESYGHPLKKLECREKVHQMVKKALLNSQLLLLNFDDHVYPETVLQQLHAQQEGHPSFGHDPNLKEFSGSKAFPSQFWRPLDLCKNRELLEQIGLVKPEDEAVPEALTDSAFFAVWSTFQVIGRA